MTANHDLCDQPAVGKDSPPPRRRPGHSEHVVVGDRSHVFAQLGPGHGGEFVDHDAAGLCQAGVRSGVSDDRSPCPESPDGLMTSAAPYGLGLFSVVVMYADRHYDSRGLLGGRPGGGADRRLGLGRAARPSIRLPH